MSKPRPTWALQIDPRADLANRLNAALEKLRMDILDKSDAHMQTLLQGPIILSVQDAREYRRKLKA